VGRVVCKRKSGGLVVGGQRHFIEFAVNVVAELAARRL